MAIRLYLVPLAAAALLAIGCSQPKFPLAPVSGVVTLDGEPLEGATLTFQPRASGDSMLAGKPSSGETDAEGRYTLETFDGYEGAVVGTHRVSISTFKKRAGDPDAGEPDLVVLAEERVPPAYNNRSKLTREVEADGENAFDFDLQQNPK